MKKFFNSQREIIAILLYAAIVYGLVYFVLMPLYREVENKRNQIQEEVVLQELQAKKIDELPKIKEQYAFIQSNKKDLTSLLEDDEVVLIEKLESLAQDTNNNIKISVPEAASASRKPQQKKQDGKSIADALPSDKYQQFSLVVSGDFQSIVKFIAKVESLSYFGDVLSIDIHKADQTPINNQNVFLPGDQGQQPQNGEDQKRELSANISAVFYVSQ